MYEEKMSPGWADDSMATDRKMIRSMKNKEKSRRTKKVTLRDYRKGRV